MQKDLLYLLKDENIKITFEAEKSDKTTDIETDKDDRAPHSTEELYYYHPDHLGTATFLTNHLGIPYQFFLNLPFGESMAEQRSYTGNFNNRWKFNGKELDEETGLYYYGARFYNPSTSLWLSVDPLVEKTMDAYGYCYQNPIMLIDPTGMSPEGGGGDEPPSEKRKALLTIDAARTHGSNQTVWNNINRGDFLNDLENIINNPGSINQGGTNLCGLTAPLVIFAEKKPLQFVEMALEFYKTGSYEGLESNKDLHNNTPTNRLNNAEYVLLTSIKNGLNIFSYDPQSDSGLSGLTTAKDVDKLMGIFGFQTVNSTNLNDINNQNYSAILLVNWDGLSGGTKGKVKDGSFFNVPTHYIQPNRFNILSNGNYDIDFTHWGRSGNNLQVTPSIFIKMVHGIRFYE